MRLKEVRFLKRKDRKKQAGEVLSSWNVTFRVVLLRESAGVVAWSAFLVVCRSWRILRIGELEYEPQMESGGVPDRDGTEKEATS